MSWKENNLMKTKQNKTKNMLKHKKLFCENFNIQKKRWIKKCLGKKNFPENVFFSSPV